MQLYDVRNGVAFINWTIQRFTTNISHGLWCFVQLSKVIQLGSYWMCTEWCSGRKDNHCYMILAKAEIAFNPNGLMVPLWQLSFRGLKPMPKISWQTDPWLLSLKGLSKWVQQLTTAVLLAVPWTCSGSWNKPSLTAEILILLHSQAILNFAKHLLMHSSKCLSYRSGLLLKEKSNQFFKKKSSTDGTKVPHSALI